MAGFDNNLPPFPKGPPVLFRMRGGADLLDTPPVVMAILKVAEETPMDNHVKRDALTAAARAVDALVWRDGLSLAEQEAAVAIIMSTLNNAG